MNISRRHFLGALSAISAIAPFAGNSAAGPLKGKWPGIAKDLPFKADALAQLGWDSFYGYLNTDFTFCNVEGRAGRGNKTILRLTSMTAALPQNDIKYGGEPNCFVLTFAGPKDWSQPSLVQKTYMVEHFALGNFELFISNGSVIDGEVLHTAVINRREN